MKTILLGNAGAGKTTLARALVKREPAAWLSLDHVAFAEGATRRPLAESVAEALHFIERHESWILEGCYGDIVEALLPCCEELIFLNPGVEICVEHCKRRPWEPEKYGSREAQEANLRTLVDWVSTYETRQDEYGLQRHRAVFEAFAGRKSELTDPAAYTRERPARADGSGQL